MNRESRCILCGGGDLVDEQFSLSTEDVLEEWTRLTGAVFSVEYMALLAQHEEGYGSCVTLVSCSNCRLEFFVPIWVGSREFYDSIVESDSNYYSASKWEFRRGLRVLKDRGARSVLDIGCGSGASLAAAKRLGFDIAIGLERSAVGLTRTSTKHGSYSIYSDEKLLRRDVGEVDSLAFFQVVEHVDEPARFVGGFLDMLRPEGLVVVAVPDNDGPIQLFPNALTNIPPHHVSRWNEQSLRALAKECGLSVDWMAKEFLPSYLWESYIPRMLEHRFGAGTAVMLDQIRLRRILNLAARILPRFGVHALPGVPGHTVLMVCRKKR